MKALRWLPSFVAASLLATAPACLKGAAAANFEPQVDRIFSKWTASTPGCAVGAATDGKPVLTKAYGMADLEHDVRNTPETNASSRSGPAPASSGSSQGPMRAMKPRRS